MAPLLGSVLSLARADGVAAGAEAAAVPDVVTIAEIAVRYQLENAARENRLEAERARADGERRAARPGPG